MNQWRALAVVLCVAASCLVNNVLAGCCERKWNFGCCGNGGCNIFCCDCDDGCNAQCEKTSCSGGEWIRCGGVVTGCVGVCVGATAATAGAAAAIACGGCMGASYGSCLKCLADPSGRPPILHYKTQGWRRYVTEDEDDHSMISRSEFFDSLDLDDSGGIDQEEFDLYKVQIQAGNRPEPCWNHAGWDTNSDGNISQDEFDHSACTGKPAPKQRELEQLEAYLEAIVDG